MNKYFIKISVSSLFPLKNRCKFCMSTPLYYYNSSASLAFTDHVNNKFITKLLNNNCKRMCKDYYLTIMPKKFTNISYFNHSIFKAFNPRYHKSNKKSLFGLIDHLSCECGKTNWLFNESFAENSPEIKQRKARYAFPTKYF